MAAIVYKCANGHTSDNPGLCTEKLKSGAVCGMFPLPVDDGNDPRTGEDRRESTASLIIEIDRRISMARRLADRIKESFQEK